MTTGVSVIQEENEKELVPFVINKALSFHYDCLPYAFIMDQNSHLSAKMQYDFYLHAVRKYKRKYVPWSKATKNEDIELIRKVYGYSLRKAIDALSILDKEQLEELRTLYENIE